MPDPRASAKVRHAFARRLNDAVTQLGLNYSEFARRVEAILKKKDPDARFQRDMMSSYIRARALPRPVNIEAMAKVLDTDPEKLLPNYKRLSILPEDEEGPTMEFKALQDGNTLVKINRPFDNSTAMAIMRIISEAEK